jgi:hypothetical protein
MAEVGLINMDIQIPIGEIIKAIDQICKNIKDAKIKKTCAMLPREIHGNLEVMRNLYRNGDFSVMKINGKELKKELDKIKTATMEKVFAYWHDCEKHLLKNNADFFDRLSLALFKINGLKKLNATPDKKLPKNHNYRIKIRVYHIIRTLVALVK